MDTKEATPLPLPETSSDNNGENSRTDSKVIVSDDEGYESGKEDFEMASDKPGVGEAIEKGNSDTPYADAVAKVGDINDDAEKGIKDDSKDSYAAVVSKDGSGIEGDDGKGEIPDSDEKLKVTSDEGEVETGEIVDASAGRDVVEDVGGKGDESVESGPLIVGNGGILPTGKEDAVVDAAEPEESKPVDTGDVVLTPEGDSVVESIQVDVAEPGVVVVGEAAENGDGVSEMETKDISAMISEPEKLEVDENADAEVMPEGDSVVDTIQVGMVGPGVAVVGEMQENGDGKIEGVEVPLQSVDGTVERSDDIQDSLGNQSSEPAVGNLNNMPELKVTGDDKDEKLDVVNGVHMGSKKPEVEGNPAVAYGFTGKTDSDGESGHVDKIAEAEQDIDPSDVTMQANGEHAGVLVYDNGLADGVSEESKLTGSAETKPVVDSIEIAAAEAEMDEEVDLDGSMSDGDTDGMIFGSSEAARKFIEELEQGSGVDSHGGAGSSIDQSQRIDGQIVTDSEEEGDTDDEGDGKELFDSAALAALLKAATGADPDGGNITITSQDGSRLFSVERPAGLGSSLQSLRPAARPNRPNLFSPLTASGGGESEENLSEEEKKKLEKLQQIRVKFLRLVHRLGLSPEESVAAQVLYRLALLGGRQGTQTFSLDAAKRMALQLEAEERDKLDFSINILVLGKSGVGKSATINSIFGEEMAPIDAFETGTASAKLISGCVDGVNVQVIDTPGLKSSVMEQGFNRAVLSSVKKVTKKSPADVVLYVDRLDAQTRDLNDLPLLKTVTGYLGPSIWRSAIVTLTHASSAPPDGPSGTPLSYEVFLSQRSHVVQQSIGHAVGDLRMMSPSLMNPVSLVENHPSCRKNREGQRILPNGLVWRPQLLLLCYSMKILSEASSFSKPQDPFDHRKLFGFKARSPPLPYMLSSMLQSHPHPKLPSDQGGDNVDSDIDLDDFSDNEQEEDEYDQLPPFKPLRKSQIARLSKEQRKAYFEEYDYRVKLLQKKQWKEELKRMREIKKKGKTALPDYGFQEDEADPGTASPVAVPLPDMALPPSFDGDNPAYRYRFLEPTSQFLVRPVLDSHGWDHDCGYDGVNLEHSFAIASRFPVAYTIQVTKDKKDFSISLDSNVAVKHGDDMSTMAGFDIQSMGKQLAYVIRGETKLKKLKKNKAAGGLSLTFLGENVVPGLKIEDQITLGKQFVLVGSAGAVRSQQDTAYGANFELQRREADYPIGQMQSSLSMSVIKWRGDWAVGFNSLAQFAIGRNSKVAVRAGINNKMSGQVTVRTSSSDHLSLALTAILPTVISIYRKLWPGLGDKYSIY